MINSLEPTTKPTQTVHWHKMAISEFSTMKYGKMPPQDVVSEEGFPIYSGYRVTGFAKTYTHEEPQLLIVARGVGGTGDVKISPPNSWITNLSIVLELDSAKVDKLFLYYKLKREPLKEKLNTGAAQAQITINSLAPYKLTIPDLSTQKKIASILSAYDDLFENNRRRIALLEQAARLLYKEWFVHFRFPGHEHVRIVDGLPEGWEKTALGKVLNLQRGFDLPTAQRKQGNIPIYASTGITGYHSVAKAKGPGIVTGRSGSLGTVLYIPCDYWPLNTTLWVTDFIKVTPIFALFLLQGLRLEQYNGGAAVPTLNRNDVHKIEIFLPSQKLIDEFSEQAEILYLQIQKLNELNQKLEQAREILLPRLINGELVV